TANGAFALFDNTTGNDNTATGFAALGNNTTGNDNTANGANALLNNTTGGGNTAIGIGALLNNTTGSENTATGLDTLAANTTGGGNTVSGRTAMANNTTGNNNTATGIEALLFNTTGIGNTAMGSQALEFNTIGGGNTAVGQGAGASVSSANNVICIGANGENVDNSCYIGQIFGATSSGGTAVVINSNNKLGTVVSSKRFKEDIEPMNDASDPLFSLKPVTFHYKHDIDPDRKGQFGLVAEDVEKINPDLVVRDKEGKPYSVRYDQVNARLLNKFLKAHRRLERQEATIARQQIQIETLTSGLEKVNAELQASKLTSQVVLKDQ